VAPGAIDADFPIQLPDVTKSALLIMKTDRPVTFKVDADVTVRRLDNVVVIGGSAVRTYFGAASGAVALLKFTNPDGVNAASVRYGFAATAD
jgi:hypothetical protein